MPTRALRVRAAPGDAYCSPRCAGLDVDALVAECGCGHPDCRPHHAEPIELHAGDPAPSAPEVEEDPH